MQKNPLLWGWNYSAAYPTNVHITKSTNSPMTGFRHRGSKVPRLAEHWKEPSVDNAISGNFPSMITLGAFLNSILKEQLKFTYLYFSHRPFLPPFFM